MIVLVDPPDRKLRLRSVLRKAFGDRVIFRECTTNERRVFLDIAISEAMNVWIDDELLDVMSEQNYASIVAL